MVSFVLFVFGFPYQPNISPHFQEDLMLRRASRLGEAEVKADYCLLNLSVAEIPSVKTSWSRFYNMYLYPPE